MTPLHNATRHRRLLESACLADSTSPEELLALSQQLDRLINDIMRVREGNFVCVNLRGVRPRKVRIAPPSPRRCDTPQSGA